MDVPETTGSTTSGAAIAIAVNFFVFLLCLPLIGYVIWIWRPLRVNSTATGLRRGWLLAHVTGEVLGSLRHTEITARTEYGGVPGNPYAGHTSITTDVFDTLNLRLADGREHTEQVVNFNVSAFPRQVVSF